ncbi:class I SAM-dependent methyltransferase [Desertihabitans brevis]|uniref:Class I SAM-dependent methyltransferase n=1 Tax=Desertihabitans brevis TaxID=2268447 RepID=A0A367YRY4_9ACTN|nr:class I SAM-dependent methyltransferase [Desertihabitans brevis]RCK68655.1 class I SAM-dependent methyltransferase [Desertihabitans brevis]
MANAWEDLAGDYELARQRDDSFDRLLEWPAQRSALGDVTGQRILDAGCGSGAKAIALARDGAAEVVGIDIAGAFIEHQLSNVELVRADLSDLASVPAAQGRTFDTIVFFQSISYSRNQVRTLVDARHLLADGGRILVQRSHPIRFAVERAQANGTSLGEEYYSTEPYTYQSGWNSSVALTHSTETFSTMLNTFAAAGLTVDHASEPQLSDEARERYPHKQEWLNRYLGVILFELSAR